MTNATDYFSPVRDAANDLSDKLGDALALDHDGRQVLNAALRGFAHSILDAAAVEAQGAPLKRHPKLESYSASHVTQGRSSF